MSDTRKGKEFSRATKVAAIKRATINGIIRCELCSGEAMRHQVDHRIPIAQGGEPVLENAQIICEPCWKVKNPQDTKDAARSKRREARNLGIRKQPSKTINSAPFAPVDKSSKRTAMRPVQKKEPTARVIEKFASLGPGNLARRFTPV